MCTKLGVSRSGYYKWLHRKKPQTELENEQIIMWIMEYNEKFNHTLGYRRMRNYINRDKNKHYSKRRIHRLMKLLGIKSVIRKQRKKYHPSTPEITAENVLHREFEASEPNQKWVTDVTEFKIPHSQKKLYLSAIMDLYDRSIISYVLSERNNNQLVFDTLDLAIMWNPDATPLVHSDRGVQYTSKTFRRKLETQGMKQSMSRVGCCIDNGPMEGFWGIIKSEMYYISDFESKDELIYAINQFMDYYNTNRYQERFHNKTPIEIRNAAIASKVSISYPIPENKRIKKYKLELEAKKHKHCA